ncbi:MAG: CopD family protein [Candidatus Competibacteraceae bacterium]|nr:CopD family protein [Candidatus Competibacteraceae bacterium]
MLLIKYFHIVFMAVWLAGLFFLPRLFVSQVVNHGGKHSDYHNLMGRALYFWIMTPAAILTVALGIILIGFDYQGAWLPLKLCLVAGLVLCHIYQGQLLLALSHDRKAHGPAVLLLLNWAPLVLMAAIVALAAAKPLVFPWSAW